MSTAEQILSEIEAFLAKTGMPPSIFGLRVANDGHLVRDLRRGRDIRASQIDRIRGYIAGYDLRRGDRAAS